jgi:hypothetical protein
LVRILSLAVAAALCAAATAAQAGPVNLLSNGSFEQGAGTAGQTGSFTGWTIGGTGGVSPGTGPQRIQYGPNATAYGDNVSPDPFTYSPDASGSNAAFFVDDAAYETLSQTVTLVAGVTYEVGFDFFETLSGANNPNSFTLSAILGGTTLATISSGSQYGAGVWYHIYDVFTAASSGSNTFTFAYASAASPAKDVIVDDVYVQTPPVSIPEPDALAMLAAGLAALGLARQRRAA